MVAKIYRRRFSFARLAGIDFVFEKSLGVRASFRLLGHVLDIERCQTVELVFQVLEFSCCPTR